MRWSLGGNKNSICWIAANNITRVITGLPARNHGQREDWPITVKYSWLLVTQLLPYRQNKCVLRWRCLCNGYSMVKVRNVWESAVGHDKEITWYAACDKWGFVAVKRIPYSRMWHHELWNIFTISSELTTVSIVDKKNQLDVTFCILYFSSNSCSTCFGQPCAHHQKLTTEWCYSFVLVCAVAAGRLSSAVGR